MTIDRTFLEKGGGARTLSRKHWISEKIFSKKNFWKKIFFGFPAFCHEF